MSDINAILRDGSNVNMPALRAFLADLEGSLAQTNLAIATGTITALVGTRTYATRAALYADLVPAANLFALVYADSDPLKNGLYQKSGATGGGSWTGPFDLFSSAAEALVQDLVDEVEAIALTVEETAAELGDLNAATAGLIADTVGDALGVFPLVTVADDFNQNTHALIARAPSDGRLGEVGVRIRFVGSGACSITIARGADADLTFVSNTALPTVSATGNAVFDAEDLDGIVVQEGDAILFSTPVGGVAGLTITSAGHTMLFRTGSFSSGTETFSAASNTKLNAYVRQLTPTLQVPRDGLEDKDLLDDLEPLAAVAEDLVEIVEPVAELIGTRTETVGLSPLSSGTDQFNAGVTALVYTATADCTVRRFRTWSGIIGDGKINLVVGSGTPAAPTFVSAVALSDATATGQGEWVVDIPLTAGQSLYVSTPSSGVNQRSSSAQGKSVVFALGEFTSGSKTLSTTPNVQLQLNVDVEVPGISIVGNRGETSGLFPLSRGTDQWSAGNTALVFTASKACTLTEVGFWSDNIGDGKVNLVIANGTADAPIFSSAIALADATQTGPNSWALNIALTAGQHVLISAPGGGVNQMTSAVPGITSKFSGGTFTSGTKTMFDAEDTRFQAYVTTEARGAQITRTDLDPALAAQIPDIPLPVEYDMFLCIGQSNMVGSGGGVVDTVTVPAGVMKQYYSGALTDKTADPVGNASNNSALPAMALEHWRRTGHGSIFVPAASGSTSLVAAADAGSGNWSATGTLRGSAITLLNAAKTAANSAGLAWKFAGVLWCQGEQDAVAIDAATITKANYTTELGTLLTYMQTQTGSGSTMPFIISVIGSRTVAGGGDTTGFQQIRAAQIEFAAGRPNVFIGFNAAKTFVARNLMWDGVHYSARGYDEMGRALASVAAVACAGRA